MSSIGLDVGTSRVKAVRFDDRWRQAHSAGEDTVVLSDGAGRRQQDPDAVWAAAARVLGAVAHDSPDPIDFVAVTAQGDGCWLVDGDGDPVGPALLWNDNRAADIVTAWVADGTMERAFRISGSLGAPGLANALLAWLSRNDPGVLARAELMLSCGSWVYSRLTGERVIEASEAANPFCDARSGQYDPRLLELFGLGGIASLLPPIVAGSTAVATLRKEVADLVGLPQETPVVLAPYDVVTAGIGAGVTTPGAAYAVLGTTVCVGALGDDPHLDRPVSGMCLPLQEGAAAPRRWMLSYATMTGTEALDWAARLLGVPSAREVVELAARCTRTDLPLFLPYLSTAGERAPFLSSTIRAQLSGLDLSHGPVEIARSVLDGLTMAVVDNLEACGRADVLGLAGGGSASDLWCQLIADATGVPVRRPTATETGALGAVAFAAAAVGLFPSLDDAAEAAVSFTSTLTSRPEETRRYQDLRLRFSSARDRSLSQT